MKLARGQVWWAELVGDAGYRPVVIISAIEPVLSLKNVTIVEVTSVVRKTPLEVPLTRAEGMPRDCAINAANLHTIPKTQLRELLYVLNGEQLFQLDRALMRALDLEV